MAHKVQLTFASGAYDRMLPLFEGEVSPAGIDLVFVPIDEPRHIFDRLAGGMEFDVAEFSLSEYIQRFAGDACPFVAIPVFPSRAFRHGFIAVRRDRSIVGPKDLEHKTIGVPLYTMTAAVYIRGILQHEYGVDLSTVRWVEGAMNTVGSHGKPAVLPLLRECDITANDTGRSLSDLLADGKLDATLGSSLPDSLRTDSGVGRLFPDFVDLEKDYYRRTGVYPIMHTLVIRQEVHERYPFVASSLYKALIASKKLALQRMMNLRALRYMTPWLLRDVDEIHEVFDGDPWPYGVEPNRATIEALIGFLHDQAMIPDKVGVDELFLPVYE
jgi:4,5-dihydroxyphthalate decarboxylase